MVELNPLNVISISGQTVVAYTVRVSSLELYTQSNAHLFLLDFRTKSVDLAVLRQEHSQVLERSEELEMENYSLFLLDYSTTSVESSVEKALL